MHLFLNATAQCTPARPTATRADRTRKNALQKTKPPGPPNHRVEEQSQTAERQTRHAKKRSASWVSSCKKTIPNISELATTTTTTKTTATTTTTFNRSGRSPGRLRKAVFALALSTSCPVPWGVTPPHIELPTTDGGQKIHSFGAKHWGRRKRRTTTAAAAATATVRRRRTRRATATTTTTTTTIARTEQASRMASSKGGARVVAVSLRAKKLPVDPHDTPNHVPSFAYCCVVVLPGDARPHWVSRSYGKSIPSSRTAATTKPRRAS